MPHTKRDGSAYRQRSGFFLFSGKVTRSLRHSTSSVYYTSSFWHILSWFRKGQSAKHGKPVPFKQGGNRNGYTDNRFLQTSLRGNKIPFLSGSIHFKQLCSHHHSGFPSQGFSTPPLLRRLAHPCLLRGESRQATSVLLLWCSKLGIQVNWEKASLTPTQSKTFLGMEILSPLLKVFPTPTRLENLRLQLESFLSNNSPPTRDWLTLLGHMSSLLHLIPGARRRMRNLQFQLSRLWDRQVQRDDSPIPWDNHILADLQWWSQEQNLCLGQSLLMAPPDLFLYTDASTLGWGASLSQESVSGKGMEHERSLHINILELRAIRLSLFHFMKNVQGKTVAVFSDNTTALSYIIKEGGTRSTSLNAEAQLILEWAETHSVKILTHSIKGSSNVVADCLSRQHQLISTEWTLHQDVCNQLWKLWGYPTVDLFATTLNFWLPKLHHSLFGIPVLWRRT